MKATTCLCLLFVPIVLACQAEPLSEPQEAKPSYIIDTDVGIDDLMAIAFLLSRNDVEIEAVTIGNGLAHVDPGAVNVAKLLTLGEQAHVPVYIGRPAPLEGDHAFPAQWRRDADELPGVELPSEYRPPETESAFDFLTRRLAEGQPPVRILALAPLTNLGEWLRASPRSVQTLQDIVIMGGAYHVPGNVESVDEFISPSDKVEWNFFVDPTAAAIVFESGARITDVPLDATNQVPIDVAFLEQFRRVEKTALGRFVRQILESDPVLPQVEDGTLYAFDPLAGVVWVAPQVVTVMELGVEIELSPPDTGRSLEVDGGSPASVALDADKDAFDRIYMAAFSGE